MSRLGKQSFILNRAALRGVMNSPEAQRYTKGRAERIIEIAIGIFLEERELVESVTYIRSFSLRKIRRGYRIHNDDKTAVWVEYGAHAGGKTPILGYAPIRKAIDIVALEG